MDLRNNKRGQVLVLVALAMVALIGFVALAVDMGFMWGARRKMQTAADAAATAGAIASRQGQSPANVKTAATDAASLNGFTDGTNGATVTPTYPYTGGGCSANCIQVVIDQSQPTYFLQALGRSSIDVKAGAVAGTTNSGSCIYALGPQPTAFDAHGSPTVNSSCGILVNTNANCAGSFTITAPMGVAGSSNCPNSSTISYTPDPFAYLGSQPSCVPGATFTPNVSGPGSYCSGISINGNSNVTLTSGTYNLGSGGLTINGNATLTGNGVTFITTGSITMNGSGTVTLSAPTSGTYNGILIWDTSSGSNKINGSSSSTFDGALYFPNGSLTYSGSSSSGCGTGACSAGSTSGCGFTIIAADSVTFGGTTNLCDDYSSLPGGASPIESTTLYQ